MGHETCSTAAHSMFTHTGNHLNPLSHKGHNHYPLRACDLQLVVVPSQTEALFSPQTGRAPQQVPMWEQGTYCRRCLFRWYDSHQTSQLATASTGSPSWKHLFFPLWSSGHSSWLQIRRPGFDSRHYQKNSSGSGTGSTQPREYNWRATW
jgi:hypothetical protein